MGDDIFTAATTTSYKPLDETKEDRLPNKDVSVNFPTLGPADVAVYWDYENVRIPRWCPASTATECIRNKVTKYGRIVEKRLYYDSRQPTEHTAPRAELDLSGFTLVDCPSRNRKETLDKKLIVDVLCFAWERASMGAKACVVLITSDGDYSYAVARLRDIGVYTIIIYRPDMVAKVLIDNANVVMSWEYDVLGGPPSQLEEESSPQIVEEMETNVSKGEQPVLAQPSQQAKEKFALFCSVVLNAQYRNVSEGISVYSSWANEASVAASFYEKLGEKDRSVYQSIRSLATTKRLIEWGRRNLLATGTPVVKVKDRDERSDDLSLESYMKLTYLGLALLKPTVASKESDWTMVLSKSFPRKDSGDGEESTVSSSAGVARSTPPSKTAKPTKNLFVGGLAWQTTEDSLRSYFGQFGRLERVIIVYGRGFAFLSYRNTTDAATVVENNGKHFVDNKSVDVKWHEKNAT